MEIIQKICKNKNGQSVYFYDGTMIGTKWFILEKYEFYQKDKKYIKRRYDNKCVLPLFFLGPNSTKTIHRTVTKA